jgi:polysaccharide deacetylase 2 family uncharacterized protein YibQ
MANPSKKTNTKSSPRKKPVRKSRRKKRTKGSGFKKSIYIVLGVLLMILMVVFGYFLGQHAKANDRTPIAETYKTQETDKRKQRLEDLSKIKAQKPQITEERKTASKPALPEKRKDEKVTKKEEAVKKADSVKEEPVEAKREKKVRLAERTKRPKLAIIIDDVSTKSQLNKIKAIGIPMTPSIFPPSQLSMSSHTLAEGLQHYMIHLPMESSSAQFNRQVKTLITNFSKKEIAARVKELRKLFPHARYINNHTGSVFTDDYHAMLTLYKALRKEGFVFVDSRTIASTKVPQIAAAYGDDYVARDVFIDNKHTIPYIHRQLQKAVEMAKKRGYAIVIGHPHNTTMKALSSAGDIFKDVDLVYIDELYR